MIMIKLWRLELYIISGDLEGVPWFEIIDGKETSCGCSFIKIGRFGATWMSKQCVNGE